MFNRTAARRNLLVLGWLLLVLLVFGFDVFTPLGMAASVIYAVVIVLTMPLLRPTLTLGLAGLCTLLTVVSLAAAPWVAPRLWPHMSMVGMDMFNQVVGLAALWVMVGLIVRQIRITALMRREVAQRQQAEQLAEQRRRELSEFLHIAVHDLGHPVLGIRSLLTILQQDWGPRLDETNQENLSLALGECQRMGDWLKQLGRMARADLSPPTPQRVRLDQVLQRCLRQFQTRLDQRRDLRISVQAVESEVSICVSEVEEALINLIDNALKYACSVSGATLELTAHVEDRQATIEVIDHGPGIAPQFQQRIFNFFERVDPTGPVSGSGVGLAAVRRLMQRVGGQVHLHSDIGQGCTFTLRFPILPSAA